MFTVLFPGPGNRGSKSLGNGSRVLDPGNRVNVVTLGRYIGKSHNQKDLEKNVWIYEHINTEWTKLPKLLTVSW